MEVVDTLEISLINDLREIAVVAARVDEFCVQRNYAPQIGYSVNLSIEEILTNRISFGYENDEHRRIEIILRVEGEKLVTVIVDNSAPFDLSAVARNGSSDETLEDDSLTELGLFLVNQMMDGVEYRRESGCNVLIMTKETRVAAESEANDEVIPPGPEA